MNYIESSSSFGRKLQVVAFSGIAGAIGKDPQPWSFNRRLKEAYRTSPDQYRSYRSHSNSPLSALEYEICERAILAVNTDGLKSLPWTDRGFSQGLHFATMIAFSDQHDQPVAYENFVPEASRTFVDQVREAADEKGRQITLPEQFSIALDIAQNGVLDAAVVAHAGSRSISRRSDTRVDPRLNYTLEEVMQWRDCVASFEAITGEYDDPPSETYHFWGTFIAGLLSETGGRMRDRILNPIYRQFYTRAAEITEILRFKVGRKDGVTHKEADVLGYHLGSLVGSASTGI